MSEAMPLLAAEAQKVRNNADQLFSAQQVSAVIDQLAAKIARRFVDQDPLLLCVMKGGLYLSAELMQRLPFLLRVDYLHATRYRDQTQGHDLHWKHDAGDLSGQSVILIDDIFDEGHTLAAIHAHCLEKNAKSVQSVILVEKLRERSVALRPDWIGLEVPDRYVFGSGMDYKGYWRNLTGIWAVSEAS